MFYNNDTKQLTNRPVIKGITNPTQNKLLENGWVPYVDNKPSTPEGYYAKRTFINSEGVQQYEILPIPAPITITPSQGKAYLLQLNVLNQVEQMVSQDPQLKIFWENALHWDRTKSTMKGLAQQLNIDIEEFFKNASKIDLE